MGSTCQFCTLQSCPLTTQAYSQDIPTLVLTLRVPSNILLLHCLCSSGPEFRPTKGPFPVFGPYYLCRLPHNLVLSSGRRCLRPSPLLTSHRSYAGSWAGLCPSRQLQAEASSCPAKALWDRLPGPPRGPPPSLPKSPRRLGLRAKALHRVLLQNIQRQPEVVERC